MNTGKDTVLVKPFHGVMLMSRKLFVLNGMVCIVLHEHVCIVQLK